MSSVFDLTPNKDQDGKNLYFRADDQTIKASLDFKDPYLSQIGALEISETGKCFAR